MTRDYETLEESGFGIIATPDSKTQHGNAATARTIIKPGWDAVVDIKTADSLMQHGCVLKMSQVSFTS